ncbi:hydrogenase maturation protease [Mycobacterium sp. Y57]|uniref:hydrogenase maturation protease n=1 Tax=Mycolicibacterium xanthum TaxID=2796469 RepID=UPI001C846C82|nr:hydrogenase maturation protease [Mycolicibacterium xanthum]MBX7434007.1 hydrogenase maturation protease [Mycolicibacterium xanthum]
MSGSADRAPLPPEFLDDPASLVYGIGNSGREDDGLGWAFIDRLEQTRRPVGATLRRTYQLNLEDADLIQRYTRVLFVDATKDAAVERFALSTPQQKLDLSFTSHALSVSSVLATALQCFGHVPDCRVLAIRGYQWELREGLTAPAQRNLDSAVGAVLAGYPTAAR